MDSLSRVILGGVVARLESFSNAVPASDASAALSAEYLKTAKAGAKTGDRSALGMQPAAATASDATAPSLQLVSSDTPAANAAAAAKAADGFILAAPASAATDTTAAPAAAPDVSSVSNAAPMEAASAAPASTAAGSADVPPAIQKALNTGSAVRFSSADENQSSNRQPDFFLTADGKFVPNPKATPSADGSINVQLQNEQAQANKSLRDAVSHESEMQRQAAKDMIRLYQKNNPGQPVPSWMTDLANAKPQMPDFVPFAPTPQQANDTPTAAPENGFANRGVHGGGGGGGYGGFAGNGGFNGNGYFSGDGSTNDGTLYSGGYDAKGVHLSGGETVKAKEIYDYMTDKFHLSPAVASGILGNMMTESSFKTDALNKHEGAIGLCQWEGGRRNDLVAFAHHEGKPVTDWHVQVDFMMHELQTKESGAWARLEHANTPQQAAAIFDQYFERSSGEARHQRMANAEHIFHQIASDPTPAVASAATKPATHNA
jgi:hypothetical protein